MANRELYLSWKDAVKNAASQYEIITERFQRGDYPKKRKLMEGVMRMNGELMDALATLSQKFKD